MKNLFETDFVIYDKTNDNPLQDSYGRILLFGNKQEADDECRGNEIVIPCTELPQLWQDELLNQIEEPPIKDDKGRDLTIGDLVVLVEARDLDNDDLIHNAGDVFQFVGGMEDNIGCFIHCKSKKGTNFFADRTLKINKKYGKEETHHARKN
jgi:hypothetical protein